MLWYVFRSLLLYCELQDRYWRWIYRKWYTRHVILQSFGSFKKLHYPNTFFLNISSRHSTSYCLSSDYWLILHYSKFCAFGYVSITIQICQQNVIWMLRNFLCLAFPISFFPSHFLLFPFLFLFPFPLLLTDVRMVFINWEKKSCSLQLYHHYPFEHDISRDYFPQASECLPSEVSEAEWGQQNV